MKHVKLKFDSTYYKKLENAAKVDLRSITNYCYKAIDYALGVEGTTSSTKKDEMLPISQFDTHRMLTIPMAELAKDASFLSMDIKKREKFIALKRRLASDGNSAVDMGDGNMQPVIM